MMLILPGMLQHSPPTCNENHRVYFFRRTIESRGVSPIQRSRTAFYANYTSNAARMHHGLRARGGQTGRIFSQQTL